jgi:hypothetical protein
MHIACSHRPFKSGERSIVARTVRVVVVVVAVALSCPATAVGVPTAGCLAPAPHRPELHVVITCTFRVQSAVTCSFAAAAAASSRFAIAGAIAVTTCIRIPKRRAGII